MRFWTREIGGWILILFGLGAFWLTYQLAFAHYIESGVVAVFGIFIFRGGIHLLKVAVAARVCLQARDRLYPSSTLRPRLAAPLQPTSQPRRGPES
jgi:hypothetical protein